MNYQNDIRRLVEDFVAQLSDLWRQAAIESMAGFGPGGGGGGGGGRGGARGGLSLGRGRGRGGKRTSEELEQMSTQFLDYVKKNPGLRIEQINKELGTTTKDLALPIRKLVGDGVIKVKGAKRATTYTAK